MDHIHNVLEMYFKAWNDSFKSKDGSAIKRFMSKDFKGYWAHATIEEPMQYDYSYDIVSVLNAYEDAEKSFEPVSIVERNEGNQLIVTGRETSVIKGNPHRAQCMFIWRLEEDEWKLLREYIELER